ncbi:MAG: hypothetical protein ACYC5H_17260, partial [Methylovirgula sp.]
MSYACVQPEPEPEGGPARAAMEDLGRLDALRARIATITAQDNRNEFLTKSFNNLNCKAEVLQKLQPRISLGRNSHFDR